MGCGLMSMRGPSLEVHHPLALDASGRAGAARIVEDRTTGVPRWQDVGHAPGMPRRAANEAAARPDGGGRGGNNRSSSSSGNNNHHNRRDLDAALSLGERARRSYADDLRQGRPQGRRFHVGERVVMTSRVPDNIQDHAFCFECGVFFHVGGQHAPQCTRCGSAFVQYLRGQRENWIAAESGTGVNYSFDDRLDDSVSASMQESPVKKTPTEESFLQRLPIMELTTGDIEQRREFDTSDSRRTCAICRECFVVGDVLMQVPCCHEFHRACITTWLQAHNTCPICRWRAPAAIEEGSKGEEDRVEGVVQEDDNDYDEEVEPEDIEEDRVLSRGYVPQIGIAGAHQASAPQGGDEPQASQEVDENIRAPLIADR
mmetsp:Transcript_103641/g.206050  ORF Transcript_103641/g.206050 Transcript_103641/m.206050 type:complete len:372 (-) Transcript_103641:184-1299(-)